MQTFKCAVCHHTKKAFGAGTNSGKLQYAKMPNGGTVCFDCINKRDTREMQRGKRITMLIEWNPKREKWEAVNRGRGIRFDLIVEGKQSAVQVLHTPTFVDPKGWKWRGRLYPATGVAVFQRMKIKAAANGATKRMPAGVPAGAAAR